MGRTIISFTDGSDKATIITNSNTTKGIIKLFSAITKEHYLDFNMSAMLIGEDVAYEIPAKWIALNVPKGNGPKVMDIPLDIPIDVLVKLTKREKRKA